MRSCLGCLFGDGVFRDCFTVFYVFHCLLADTEMMFVMFFSQKKKFYPPLMILCQVELRVGSLAKYKIQPDSTFIIVYVV